MTDAIVKTEVRLGPPDRTPHRIVGGLVGIIGGVGIVVPPHGVLLAISGGVYLAWIVGWGIAAVAKTRRFATENSVAISALGRGELAQAQAVFARWARSHLVNIRAVARHNLGWSLIREGRLEEAVPILEDVADCHAKFLSSAGLLPTTRVDIALAHALLGKLEAAEQWYETSGAPVTGPPSPMFPAMRAMVRAVIDCRKDRAAEAATALEHAFAEHESTMTGELLRMMRVIRAFAAATADGPRNQGLVERVLADLRPRYAGEFRALAARWPEMAAFQAAHRLHT